MSFNNHTSGASGRGGSSFCKNYGQRSTRNSNVEKNVPLALANNAQQPNASRKAKKMQVFQRNPSSQVVNILAANPNVSLKEYVLWGLQAEALQDRMWQSLHFLPENRVLSHPRALTA